MPLWARAQPGPEVPAWEEAQEGLVREVLGAQEAQEGRGEEVVAGKIIRAIQKRVRFEK